MNEFILIIPCEYIYVTRSSLCLIAYFLTLLLVWLSQVALKPVRCDFDIFPNTMCFSLSVLLLMDQNDINSLHTLLFDVTGTHNRKQSPVCAGKFSRV